MHSMQHQIHAGSARALLEATQAFGPFPEYGMRIEYKPLSDTARAPTLATAGAAAFDLYADEPTGIRIAANGWALIKTGIAMAIPDGFVGMICPRSGLALKHGVTVLNGPGIIDSDYRGNVGVVIHNTNDEHFIVNHGDRIAQIMFVEAPKVMLSVVDTLPDTVRGLGGFGSSGS